MADNLFTREDWQLFRNLGTLGQKAGVGIEKLGALVVKELVDNALDAGASVNVREENNWIIIEDDGPGIDPNSIETLFSINRPLTSSKIIRLPQRGALGNGLRVVMGAVFASNGKIEVQTKGFNHALMPLSNGHTAVTEITPVGQTKGVTVRLQLGEAIPRDFPWMFYASVASAFSNVGTSYKEAKTSVYWYDQASFFDLLQSAGDMPINNLLGMFRDFNPKTLKSLNERRNCNEIDLNECGVLLDTLRDLSKKMSPTVLGKIGELDDYFYGIRKGEKLLGHSKPAVLPYVVESYIHFNNSSTDELILMINKTPVTGEIVLWREGKGVKSKLIITGCGLNHYIDAPKDSVSLIINITTPYMPITNDGKNPNLKGFLTPILESVKSASAKAKKSKALSEHGYKQSQREVIERYIEPAIAKASGNGQYRYSLRQLYYQIRPFLQGMFEKELEYNYFASVVTDYETNWGELQGLYRDARGIIYHPHTGEEIPLGTLAVEAYKRPKFTFNKILYCEKEGLFQILKDEKWPEKNDCALLSSKGYASRAARDVIDMIGNTEEEIHFFCIHDADASGTLIYQSLVEATRARLARRVTVHNLGLEPQEAMDMGLETETFSEGKKSRPVARYVDYTWEKWFQTNRIELNAMDTPTLLEWLDSKMEGYVEKIIPPEEIMRDQLLVETERYIRNNLAEKILKEARLDQLVDVYTAKALENRIDVTSVVKEGLEERVQDRWDAPLKKIAFEISNKVL